MPLFRCDTVPYIVQYNVPEFCRSASFFSPGPVPNFHVDADPDSEWHHNNAGPHAVPTSRWKIFTQLFLVSTLPQYNVLPYLSRHFSVKCVFLFRILDSILKFTFLLFHLLGTDADPDPAK